MSRLNIDKMTPDIDHPSRIVVTKLLLSVTKSLEPKAHNEKCFSTLKGFIPWA